MDNLDNQQLTKKERRLLRRREEEQERVRLAKQKKVKNAIFIFLPLILIVGGIIFISISSSSPENQGAPKIIISSREYDAGTVSMSDGLVKHTYEIKNIGDGDLKINKIWTSCMCTTARLKVGDKTSPEFGMHDKTMFWAEKIAPNQTGFLEITFDPAFHGPQGTGLVVRVVYLSTNDPENKKAEVRLLVNVVQ